MISVVIPIFNKCHTIAATIESVLVQTFQQYEIVLVDDGSTDDIHTVFENYVHDQRFKIVRQANQGVSVARNVGVANASFDYIAFLDADDLWLPGYLESMYAAINLFQGAAMYCSAGYVRNNAGTYLRMANKYEGQILEVNFFENPHVFLHTSATVVNKVHFFKVGGFPAGMKRNQDFALFFSLAFSGPVIYSGFPLSIYIGDVSGQATKTRFERILGDIIARFNHVHNNWVRFSKCNLLYITFTKYELRHLIYAKLRDGNMPVVKELIAKLDPELLKFFSRWELLIYKTKVFYFVSVSYILFTKAKWRTGGFPVVKSNNLRK